MIKVLNLASYEAEKSLNAPVVAAVVAACQIVREWVLLA